MKKELFSMALIATILLLGINAAIVSADNGHHGTQKLQFWGGGWGGVNTFSPFWGGYGLGGYGFPSNFYYRSAYYSPWMYGTRWW